jgi:uncharacterized protein with FMN-binding domain/succinate dehydrogenase/fumarate reductase flavoprotein subunit
MNKQLSRRAFLRTTIAGGTAMAAAAVHAAPAGIYKPGTYSAKAAGIGGDVVVTMTFDANKITDVVIDASHETPGIGQAAAPKLKEALLKMQTSEVDTISGASVTSSAVRKAAAKCIQQAKGEIPVEVITKKTENADAGKDDGDWLGKPPEINEKDIVATNTTDILVIGCGTGGMVAVATAAEAGAKVIGIDRFAVGTGVRTFIGALDSRYEKKAGAHIDKFDMIRMASEYSGGHIQPELIRLWCDESGATVDWYGDRLAERGVELWYQPEDKNEHCRFQLFPVGHRARFTGSNDGKGHELDGSKVLYDYAVRHGARFDYNMKMVKLEKKNGRVTGCIAENGDGKYVRYIANRGTIVCTGGYSKNFRMLKALQPWNTRIIGRSDSMPGSWGEGIRACLWAGAKMDETHSLMIFDRCALRRDQEPGPETTEAQAGGLFWMGSQPWLKVNADGKRFFNESGNYAGILHSDEYQKGHCHYTIFDSTWPSQAKQFKMHGCSRLFPFENGADPMIPCKVIEEQMLPQLVKDGYVQKADTIEELAEKLGLPKAQLKATVDRYNKMAEKGEDTDFGKEAFRLLPVAKPPFYGAKNTGLVLCTMDGIQINTHMNAIDIEGNPIPGLYVVGNDSGGFFSNDYPSLVTGMACGRTITFARHVARELAKGKA